MVYFLSDSRVLNLWAFSSVFVSALAAVWCVWRFEGRKSVWDLVSAAVSWLCRVAAEWSQQWEHTAIVGRKSWLSQSLSTLHKAKHCQMVLKCCEVITLSFMRLANIKGELTGEGESYSGIAISWWWYCSAANSICIKLSKNLCREDELVYLCSSSAYRCST